MTAARAAKELQYSVGVDWTAETLRRVKQALGVSQADPRSIAVLWDVLLTQMGYVYGTYTQKIAAWQRVTGNNHSATYAALDLLPYHA